MPRKVVVLRVEKAWFPQGVEVVEGEALVLDRPLSFLGDVDPVSGVVRDLGVSVAGKVLLVERFRGSTVGSYVLYALKKVGRAPRAIVSKQLDPVVIAGCVLSSIPIAYAPGLGLGDRVLFAELRRDRVLKLVVEVVG